MLRFESENHDRMISDSQIPIVRDEGLGAIRRKSLRIGVAILSNSGYRRKPSSFSLDIEPTMRLEFLY
jgi:hypothetical protein